VTRAERPCLMTQQRSLSDHEWSLNLDSNMMYICQISDVNNLGKDYHPSRDLSISRAESYTDNIVRGTRALSPAVSKCRAQVS
jgi:hypothetical protein